MRAFADANADLKEAWEARSIPRIEAALQQKANPFAKFPVKEAEIWNDYHSYTFVWRVAKAGDLEIMRILAQHIRNPNPYEKFLLSQALIDADKRGEKGLEIVTILIKLGANVNHVDEEDNTPLRKAAEQADNPSILEALIRAGADINATKKTGRSALDAAKGNGHTENEKLLRELLLKEKAKAPEAEAKAVISRCSPNLKQYKDSNEALGAAIKNKDHALIKCAFGANASLVHNYYCEHQLHCLESDTIPLPTILAILTAASPKQLNEQTHSGNAFDHVLARQSTHMPLEILQIFAAKKVGLTGKNKKANEELEDFCRMGLQKHYGQPGVAEAMPYVKYGSQYNVGQKIKTREYGEGIVLRICKSGVVMKNPDGKYDPIFVSKRDLSSTEYPTEKASPSSGPRICLAFDATGALTCRDMPGSSCLGNRFWAGPGPCASFKNKTVQQLNKSDWGSLIAAFNGEAEDRNKPDEPKQQSKVERCQKACRQKKCGSKMSGEYTASVSASLRCAGFCDQECSTNPERYR